MNQPDELKTTFDYDALKYSIVSAATEGSGYVDMLQRLHQIYLPYPVEFVSMIYKDLGSWAANTRTKPLSIADAILDGHTVLAVDADTIISQPPDTLPGGIWDVGVLNQFVPGHKNPVVACVIAVRPTMQAMRFVIRWLSLCMSNPGQQDHGHLTTALTRTVEEGLILLQLEDTLRGKVKFNALSPERKQASF